VSTDPGTPALSSAPVPFVDLEAIHAPIRGELQQAIDGVVERGDFILGEAVDRFEEEFAAYLGVGFAVGVNSGTAALAIALRAAGVGRGDEVIVPAHTYIASALGVVHAGARPVLCDVDEASGLIELESAAAVVSDRTAAVMPVHLYGQACDMDAITDFARAHHLAVIEDAAQAHGAAWVGRRVGSFGVASAFSFYPSKNLGAFGDAGMVCTDDAGVAEAARRLRNLGQLGKGDHAVVGYNERLDSVQAAVLGVKLNHLDRWNASRAHAATAYFEHLPAEVATLPRRRLADDVYHLFPVRVAERATVRSALARAGIGTGVHYAPAVHQQPSFGGQQASVGLPTAERWAAEELSLPMFAGLGEGQVRAVCDALRAALHEVSDPEIEARARP
jgi:dTDP-3-amino-3,4,6-trideoxy-alpha-D-glucose transaminase